MRIIIFTDTDLDGSGSALFIKWLYGSKCDDITIIPATELTIVGEILSRSDIDRYDKVFVLDLCLNAEQIQKVDRENLVLFDHHAPHVKLKELYRKGKAIIEDHTSCVGLLRKKFASSIKLTPMQEDLINCVDDYDCYALKHRDSLKLNAIHKTYNNPKVEKFIAAFDQGLRSYTVEEKNSIKLFIRKFKEQLANTVHIGKIKDYSTVAIFADFAISEVANYIITKYKADIGIVVNLKTNTVSFRRCSHCNMDLSVIASKVCNGGGTPSVAGGSLTNEFANLIRDFVPC